jgi:hypothetical protein
MTSPLTSGRRGPSPAEPAYTLDAMSKRKTAPRTAESYSRRPRWVKVAVWATLVGVASLVLVDILRFLL